MESAINADIEWSVGPDGVGTLLLNRAAKRNALSPEMVGQALEAIPAMADEGIRVATIRGAGTAFCSGVDTSGGLEPSPGQPAGPDLLDALALSPIFWVAVVEGPALGAGAAIPAVCPLTVATTEAWFSLPEIDLGLYPAPMVAYLEPRLGRQFCLEWGLLGHRISAAEAQQRGLVSMVVDPPQLEATVTELTARLTALPWATERALTSWQALFRSSTFLERKAVLDRLLQLPPADWNPPADRRRPAIPAGNHGSYPTERERSSR
jgi:enoyl-CoA hydratase/carnithine racemase